MRIVTRDDPLFAWWAVIAKNIKPMSTTMLCQSQLSQCQLWCCAKVALDFLHWMPMNKICVSILTPLSCFAIAMCFKPLIEWQNLCSLPAVNQLRVWSHCPCRCFRSNLTCEQDDNIVTTIASKPWIQNHFSYNIIRLEIVTKIFVVFVSACIVLMPQICKLIAPLQFYT